MSGVTEASRHDSQVMVAPPEVTMTTARVTTRAASPASV